MAAEQHLAPDWRMGLSNLSLPQGLLVLGGVEATREYLQQAGMQQGLDWAPATRTRLYAEIGALAKVGRFDNVDEGWQLIGGMQSSFAQPLSRIHTLQQVRERALMPPVRLSLIPLRRMQQWVGRRLYTKLYTEELGSNESYNERNAPFVRAQTISPDLAYKKGYSDIAMLTSDLAARGIDLLTFSTVHSLRPAQDHPATFLEPWQAWLPPLLRTGKIGELAVSFGRSDLKPRQSAAIGLSFDQLREILSGDPRDEHLGDLPAMLATVRAETTSGHRPLVTLHAPAAQIHQTVPNIQPNKAHRLLGEFVAERLGFALPEV